MTTILNCEWDESSGKLFSNVFLQLSLTAIKKNSQAFFLMEIGLYPVALAQVIGPYVDLELT